jgi:hypothetical protein
MSFDLRLDPVTRDLKPGIVTGSDEIVQRLVTRLKRELGEWFLAASAGIPWYQDGRGILGSKIHNMRAADLLIRREALETEGRRDTIERFAIENIRNSRTIPLRPQVL